MIALFIFAALLMLTIGMILGFVWASWIVDAWQPIDAEPEPDEIIGHVTAKGTSWSASRCPTCGQPRHPRMLGKGW